MRRLIWIAVTMIAMPAWAQTPPPTMTQYTGTVRDLTGAVVTSGRITWTTNAPSGGVIAGTGAFVSTTVSCQINATGNPVASSDGTSPCQVVNNTALTPTGTSYKICIQPYNVSPGSCYNSFAIGGIIDISTIVPTPTTQPYYGTPGGAQGPTGLTGPAGSTGPTGPANSLAIGTVTTIPAGGAATATITGTPPSQTLSMGIVTGNTGPSGPTGAALNFLGLWNSATTYTAGQVVVYNNVPYVALVGNTNVTPVDGATWIHISATDVVCQGTNDTPTIQAALNGAGFIQIKGTCLLSPSGGHLTIKSSTYLDASAATITYSPTTVDYIIGNTQIAQTISRSCADVTITAGSTTITSPTCNFTYADVRTQSISCIGGYAGGQAWATVGMGTDHHTTLASINNATTAYMSDPPTVSLSPTTCNFYTRDHDITIVGGTWNILGTVLPNASSPIKLMSVNRLRLDNITTIDGSATSNTNQGSYMIYVIDVTDFVATRLNFSGWLYQQDGIHVTGPARQVKIADLHGHTGDDFVALTPADGDPQVGNTNIEGRVYGVIDGVDIENLNGSNYSGAAAIKVQGPSGTPIPVKNVTISHIHGSDQFCYSGCSAGTGYKPGFVNGVYLFSGSMQNFNIDGVDGNILAADVLIIASGTGGQDTNVVNLTARNLTSQAFGGTSNPYNGNNYLFNMSGGRASDIMLEGLRWDDRSTASAMVNVSTTATITHLIARDLQAPSIQGNSGNIVPIRINGTINDLVLDNIQFIYNQTVAPAANAAIINFAGAQIGRASIHKAQIQYLAGSLATNVNALVQIGAYQPGNIIPNIGSLGMSDIYMNSATQLAQEYLVYTQGAAGTAYQLGSMTLRDVTLNNMGGCIFGQARDNLAAFQVSNLTTTNIQTPASCWVQQTAMNVTGPQKNYGTITNYASLTFSGISNFPVAGISTAATGGTLPDNTTYYYVPVSVTAVGFAPGAERTITTCPGGCAGQNTVSLSAAPPAGTTSVNLYRGTAPGAELLCTPSFPWNPLNTVDTISIVDTGLTCTGAAVPTTNTTQPTLSSPGWLDSGPTFVVTSGCTSNTLSGGPMGGTFKATSTTCSPVITPGITAPHGFACTMTDMTTGAATIRQTGTTVTTATFTGASVATNDVFVFTCRMY